MINVEAVTFYLGYIRKHGHFEMTVAKTDVNAQAACDQILDCIIAPLLPISRQTFVYHNCRTIVRHPFLPPVPKCVAKHPTRLTIDPKAVTIAEYRAFWRWILHGTNGAYGNLVLRVPEKLFQKELITLHCYDPVIVTNLRSGVSPRAVSYCRRAVTASEDLCCVFYGTASQIHVCFFGRYRFLSALYRRCVKDCRIVAKGLEEELRPKSKAAMKRALKRMRVGA